MSVGCEAYLAALQDAADAASRAEHDYRREAAERIAALETARAFAFRRVNLMRGVAHCASAEDEQAAVQQAQALLQDKLGWTGDNDFRSNVATNFAHVALAVFASSTSGGEPIAAALANFESWYEAHYASSFWNLFEQHMPETPRVDF